VFEIGTSLREARLRQGIDIVEAEAATKVRTKYLSALEEERFEILPAQTYVKGFLRTYAEYLGLDGQLYVDEYNSRYARGEDENTVRTHRQSLSRERRRIESNVLLLALAGIAAVTALVFVAWKWGGAEQQEIPGLAAQTTAATGVAGQATPTRRRVQWVSLELTATKGSSAVAVYRYRGSARGKLLWDGTLEPGKSQRFVGPRLWLRVKEPQNVTARLNGRRVRVPTSRGALVASRRGLVSAGAT